MMSLLRELLEEEGSKAICEVLLKAASSNARRNVDLNRVEVVVDANDDSVEIFDVLQADEGERVSLDQFRATVQDALSRLA
jgi:hypothetical protein